MSTSHPDGLVPVSDDRRRFLRFLGAGTLAVGAAGTLAACDSNEPTFDTPNPAGVTLDFSNDFGPLNYAYALEQLEGAFYTLVVDNFIDLFDSNDQRLLRDLEAHEGIHRDFLRAALGANAIPTLTVDRSAFAGISTREQILDAALLFEDLGVAAYNGAGRYISRGDFLTLAGKIVSVEARHAAAIATARFGSMDNPRLGATGVIDENGLDRALPPQAVINAASQYVVNDITVTNA